MVDGDIFQALRCLEAYIVEISNRAVLAVYHGSDFEHLSEVARMIETWGHPVIPTIPEGVQDPTQLELVTTDLREQDWFQLTLRKVSKEEDKVDRANERVDLADE